MLGVGFWRRKAIYLKGTAQALTDKHDGHVPATLVELCALPGVGMKMAQITMAVAHKVSMGTAALACLLAVRTSPSYLVSVSTAAYGSRGG